MNQKTVIFNLDGTLVKIDKRRELASVNESRFNWAKILDPEYLVLDEPNVHVISMFKHLKAAGYRMVIFSGRSERTREATIKHLKSLGVECDLLQMRPEVVPYQFMKDYQLKKEWLHKYFPGEKKNNIEFIFENRNRVIDMWREEGLTCFQVASG